MLSKPDNMTIDEDGNLLIQEDPGNNPQLARIVAYEIETGRRGALAQFDAALFSGSNALTTGEESSGIIDASDFLKDGTFLLDAQVHAPSGDPETVELGQLMLLEVDSFRRVYNLK